MDHRRQALGLQSQPRTTAATMTDDFRLSGSSTAGNSLLYGLDQSSTSTINANDEMLLEDEDTDDANNAQSIRRQRYDNITLTARPHAFAGAVLSPKHARELTPSLCLAIASALAEQQQQSRNALLLTSSHAYPLPHSKSPSSGATTPTSATSTTAVPYTLWITEAWRVLGWAEPSAALFWEMATMFHTLYIASRAFAQDYYYQASNRSAGSGAGGGSGSAGLNGIPPILSCGSTSSMGSGTTADHTHNSGNNRTPTIDKKKFSATASAKELPVWLVGTFLLLHCEEFAYQRNLAGQDERRFGAAATGGAASVDLTSGKVDFSSLFKHSALSPRTRLHAGWNNDNTHCTVYLLRHLRKILLLTAVSHSPDAVRASMHLAAVPSPSPSQASAMVAVVNSSAGSSSTSSAMRRSSTNRTKYSAEEIRRQHDEEHGSIGLNVQLTMDDLEHLHLVIQPPMGGGIDDPPLKIGEYVFKKVYHTVPPPTATLSLKDVEREIRHHLELELLMSAGDHDDGKDDVGKEDEDASKALAKLTLSDGRKAMGAEVDSNDRAKQPNNQYQKELSYVQLRGTTILLKPNLTEASSGASSASGDQPNFVGNVASVGRLHDLAISDCSDAHFYLLQPFEHATISGCTGCTIVVGAVAGLLHIVDCEKTNITSASRRILVSNSCDVQLYVFSPSPPLLVGDNRSCQFAPYNTYYDGLREDLLATGLAAAVIPENQSPYHGGRNPENDAAWPPLQCASNKWKQPVELSKLEVPQVPISGTASPPSGGSATPSSPGADDKAMGKGGGNDTAMLSPILMPASEFHVLFVPLESDSTRQRRLETEENENDAGGPIESQYCQLLAEVLQLSPFRLPIEYERRVLMKAERMRNIQQAVKKHLTEDQQRRFEEELNRGFRDWLVTSGNLRQVLDLVHLERRGGV